MKNIFEVGGFYSRYTIGDVFNDTRIKTSREGIVVSGDAVLLFVTLDKEAQSNTNLRYNDFFEQDLFHWDSQNRQTINSPTIKKIVDKTVEVFLFTRLQTKTKSKTNEFIYCGKLQYQTYLPSTSKPVHIIFEAVDFQNEPNIHLARVYDWTPDKNQPRTVNYAEPSLNKSTPRKDKSVGQGYARDQEAKVAVELRAMKVATEFYEKQGYEVVDKSTNEPYDLLCAKNNLMLRVEVKGTIGQGKQVYVTANEVKEARLSGVLTNLFIVYEIELDRSGDKVSAVGGKIIEIVGWNPLDEDLIPTEYRYILPSLKVKGSY